MLEGRFDEPECRSVGLRTSLRPVHRKEAGHPARLATTAPVFRLRHAIQLHFVREREQPVVYVRRFWRG